MIIIAGTIDFNDQATRDGAVAAAATLQQSTRSDEKGCIAYAFSADSSVPERVQVYECWVDTDSLAAHFVHENFLAMRQVLGQFQRVSSSVAKYRVDLTEPVYDETRTPRADFFTALE